MHLYSHRKVSIPRRFIISYIRGSGKGFCLSCSFNSRKSKTHRTRPFFFGTMNVGDAHADGPHFSSTPSYHLLLFSVLIVLTTWSSNQCMSMHWIQIHYFHVQISTVELNPPWLYFKDLPLLYLLGNTHYISVSYTRRTIPESRALYCISVHWTCS